jgi:hypothetical protein
MNYAKLSVVLPAVVAAMLLVGCFASGHEDGRAPQPGNYQDTMTLLGAEIREIDRHVIAQSWRQATTRTSQALEYATVLGNFEPTSDNGGYAAYRDYDAQVADLRRATDRLLYMLEQRRSDDIRDMLREVATRYNRLSMNYGPESTIGVLGEPAASHRAADRYSGSPEELRNR